eukprot:2416332-Heterocapsa_arctica.AAC.1
MQKPRDFKFAFSSAEEAGGAAGPLAAEAWTAIKAAAVDVPTPWTPWTQSRSRKQGELSEARSPGAKVNSVWSGLKKRNGRAEDPLQDMRRRESAAKGALALA